MGVDAEFYVKPSGGVDADSLESLDLWCKSNDEGVGFHCCIRDHDDPAVMCVMLMARYYGPGYERGPWPELKRFGDSLAVYLGETAELFYGTDHGGSAAAEAWGTARAVAEDRWQQVGHLPYYRAFRNVCDCGHCVWLLAGGGA